MGLIGTAASTVKTFANFANAKQFGTQVFNNAKKWVGLDGDDKKIQQEQPTNTTQQNGKDLRGAAQACRSGKFALKNFTLNDYCWKEDLFQEGDQFKNKVQTLVLHQFQPYKQNFLGQIPKKFAQSFKDGKFNLTKQDGEEAGKALGGAVVKVVGAALQGAPGANIIGDIIHNFFVDFYSKDPTKLYQNKSSFSSSNPIAAIKNMFKQGKFLNSYQLPLIAQYDRDQTLINTDVSKFTSALNGGGFIGSVSRTFGVDLSDINKKIHEHGVKNVFTNIPSTPKFHAQLDLNKNGISTMFYLINSSDEDLVKNFVFLNNLAAGSMVVQLGGGLLQSPNVYYAQIPGKRQMIWAQMGIKVVEKGRLRRHKSMLSMIKDQIGEYLFGGTGDDGKSESTDISRVFWPEAWYVTVTLSDLTQSSFNVYLNYMKNGSSYSSLETTQNWLAGYQKEAISEAQKYLKTKLK